MLTAAAVMLGACAQQPEGIRRSQWEGLGGEAVVAFVEGRVPQFDPQGLLTPDDIVAKFGEPPYVDDTRQAYEGAPVLEWRYPDAEQGEVWVFFFHLDVPACTETVPRGCSLQGPLTGWFLADMTNPTHPRDGRS